MSFWKKMFGGDGSSAADPAPGRVEARETYEGFEITATPIKEGSQFRLAGTIRKEIDGAVRTHRLIRADLFGSAEEAGRFALVKARQVIDEQGERIFHE